MHRHFNKLLLFIFIMVSLAFFQSGCKKQDIYPAQQLPKIISVNPTAAIPGDTVVIKGTNLLNVSDIKFGTMEATSISTSKSDTSLLAIIPDSIAPGDVYVQVYYSNGTGYAATKFTVLAKPKIPTISAVNPLTALPGDSITITGINFSAVSSVTFDSLSAHFTINDSTKLTVTVPSTIKGAHPVITVSAPTGFDTVSFTINYTPVITSVTPGEAKEGDIITVSGVRFTGVTAVNLGSLATTFTFINDTTLTFAVPKGAASGTVSIVTPNGTATSTAIIVIDVAGFKQVIYDDVVQGGFGMWGGWGGVADYANTTQVESGSSSIQIHYQGQWGSPMQLGGANIDLTQYTTFKISIYGGPGTNGRLVNIGFNGADGKSIALTEGKWTDYVIPISEISSSTTLTQLTLKEYSGVANVDEIIYVDNIGLN